MGAIAGGKEEHSRKRMEGNNRRDENYRQMKVDGVNPARS
jgi:hypothetical protein